LEKMLLPTERERRGGEPQSKANRATCREAAGQHGASMTQMLDLVWQKKEKTKAPKVKLGQEPVAIPGTEKRKEKKKKRKVKRSIHQFWNELVRAALSKV